MNVLEEAVERMRAMVEYLKALGDGTRLNIMQQLAGGEKCVCELVETLDMTQSAVSHHLRILRQAGLISDRREGKWVYYSIDREQFLHYHRLFSELYVETVAQMREPEGGVAHSKCR